MVDLRNKPRAVEVRTREDAQENDQIVFVETLTEDGIETPQSRESRLNYVAMWLIATIVFLAPIPAASNRPLPWAFWSFAVAILVVFYVGTLLIFDRDRRFRILRHKKLLVLAAVVPVFAVIQTLPLPWSWGGGDFGLPSNVLPNSWTLNESASLLGAVRMASYLGLFILTYEACRRTDRIRKLLWLIFFGIVLHAIWAMIALNFLGDIAPWGPKTDYLGLATGTFVNRNSFASYLGMGVIIGVVLVIDKEAKRRMRHPRQSAMFSESSLRNIGMWLLIAFLFLVMFATQSRMGFAASLVASVTVAIGLASKVSRSPKRAVLSILGGMAILIVLAGLVLAGDLAERFLYSTVSFDMRLELYKQTFGIILERPFTGIGLDNFQLAFPLVHSPELPTHVVWDLAHNTYLTLWTELGLIVGTLQVLVVGSIFMLIIRSLVRHKQALAGGFSAAGAIVLAAVHSLVDFSFEMEANVLIFVVLLAAGLSHVSLASSPRANPSRQS